MRLRASLHCVFSTLMCFLKERCESHHSPRYLVDSSTGRGVFPILMLESLWTLDRGAVKCTTLHLWAANLKPFLVGHSCRPKFCYSLCWGSRKEYQYSTNEEDSTSNPKHKVSLKLLTNCWKKRINELAIEHSFQSSSTQASTSVPEKNSTCRRQFYNPRLLTKNCTATLKLKQ